MNRNTNMHFASVPQIHTKRSKFDESHSVKTTFNTGDVIPIYVDSDILPGDTVQMDMSELVRMATPIYPIMDNLYLDLYWFFTPTRLLWDHWKAFWGENENPWTQQTEYEVPQIEAPAGGWTEGTIADYMGIPTKVSNFSINALPFRAYVKVWNDFFRDENLKSCCHMYTDETTRTGKTGAEVGYDPVTDTEFGGKPLKAAKFADYFTGALPSPQKGPAVQIPLLGDATIITRPDRAFPTGQVMNPLKFDEMGRNASGWVNREMHETALADGIYDYAIRATTSGGSTTENGGMLEFNKTTRASVDNINAINPLIPNNLYADLATATTTTINQLRTAFAIQKYYENAGLHGTRYIEYLRGVFGVTSSDGRLQRSEYLGGQRVPLNIDQIIQTSSTDATSPQGNTAGFSCTINRGSMFTKSFEEHGILLCLAVVRTDHTYQQGLNKMWTRKKWTDYFNPFFSSLGEMPILNENLYLQGSTAVDENGEQYDKQAFGYQEAWAEYRYKENRVTGYMRSNATGSLDVWHFADDYNSMPYLSGDWIDETYENVDRTIAVTSQLTHQFIGDFYFKAYYTRPMPVYSIPGLIDHV